MARAESRHQYIFDQTISEQREDHITNQLVAFNQAHSTALPIGQYSPLPLHLYVLDQEGTIPGGLVGRTHTISLWFEISVVWIDEGMRYQGLGRQLMEHSKIARQAKQSITFGRS